jgi:ferric-dicitrate binding protein FerR (iron transport regulator)
MAPELLRRFTDQESFRNWAQGIVEEDCRQWDAWVAQHPDEAPKAYLAAALLVGMPVEGNALGEKEIGLEWLKIRRRIQALEAEGKTTPAIAVSYRSRRVRTWSFAAAASIAVIVGSWYYTLGIPIESTYATTGGQHKVIRLSDNTVINLNEKSSIVTKARNRFAPEREIWLDGEAYFSVVSHKNDEALRPFVVHTDELNVNVVGTQFNVRARNHKADVFLNEGKVILTSNTGNAISSESVEMIPGDFVSVVMEAGRPVLHKSNQKHIIPKWREGYYIFNNTTLKEVFDLVQTSQGVTLEVDNPELLKESVSGKIPTSNLASLCNSIANLYQLNYTQEGDAIQFSAKKSPPAKR